MTDMRKHIEIVNEGFMDTIKKGAKKVKRYTQGWNNLENFDELAPKEIRRKIEQMDTDELIALADLTKEYMNDGIVRKGSPLELRMKLLTQEMRRRNGLTPSGKMKEGVDSVLDKMSKHHKDKLDNANDRDTKELRDIVASWDDDKLIRMLDKKYKSKRFPMVPASVQQHFIQQELKRRYDASDIKEGKIGDWMNKNLGNQDLEAHGKKLKKKRDADAHKQHSDRLKKMGMHEEELEESPGHNFTALDLQKLSSIKNLDQLKDKAFELISNPESGKPMKPEKVAWFKNRLTQLRTPTAVIKMMWDMLLSGEGMGVIGQRHTMGRNTYRQQFGEEQLEEAPTMDTTQLVTMLKNAGLTEDAIQEKLNEWGNTPEGVGEVEPTEHGDAYDYAEGVNLSLKRYLDAQDMKVGIAEHKVEDMKALYEEFKKQQIEESTCSSCGAETYLGGGVCDECGDDQYDDDGERTDEAVIDMGPDEMPELEPEMDMDIDTSMEPEMDMEMPVAEPDLGDMAPELDAGPEMGMGDMEPAMDIPSTEPAGGREETKADLEVMALRKLAGLEGTSL